ncbi:MAG: hypothetical protein U0704_07340 [Candidatus Eisenbacteria bacterium]
MRVPIVALLLAAFTCAAGAAGMHAHAASVPGESVLPEPGATAVARARLLACDSAEVMLEVQTTYSSTVRPDGSIRSHGTSEFLARGSNDAAWVKRFADALLPEGRAWKLRAAPATNLDRSDGRDPWSVRVTGYVRGNAACFWHVNLLDGWAGEGLGPPVVFDLLGPADSLRAVLAAGMKPDPDGARRLRKIHEPDAAILPLPPHLQR